MINPKIDPLPCPFCGEEPKLHYFNHQMTWYVQCSNWKCGSKTHSDTQTPAIAAWNTRAPQPRITPEEWDAAGMNYLAGDKEAYSDAVEKIMQRRSQPKEAE